MNTGDLIGSGTISGPEPRSGGSLLELSRGGQEDIMLAGMNVRRFLKDGDTVVLRGSCGPPGQRVGFGDCVGRIETAVPL
jgi:fumarylacetoacetase